MQSAGNDIVALCSINKERTRNSRFYRQILSEQERQLFHASINTFLSFDHFVWMAWSVKESAYKYFKRSDPQLVFSPTKIVIQNVDPVMAQEADTFCYKGSFTFEDHTCYFKTKINAAFIASIVNDDACFDKIKWGIRKINSSDSIDQSREVRVFLLEALSKHFPGKELQVSFSNGQYPIAMHDAKNLDVPISFSHHSSFVSYAFVSPV